jgi:hypothetical protein
LAYRQRKEAIEKQIKEHNQAKIHANKNNKKDIHSKSNSNTTFHADNQKDILNQDNKDASELSFDSKTSICPFKTEINSLSDISTNNADNKAKLDNPNNEEDPNVLKMNKKMVVSIQTSEEKAKENILSINSN